MILNHLFLYDAAVICFAMLQLLYVTLEIRKTNFTISPRLLFIKPPDSGLDFLIALKFDRNLGSATDAIIIEPNLWASRLHEIWQAGCLVNMGPGSLQLLHENRIIISISILKHVQIVITIICMYRVWVATEPST